MKHFFKNVSFYFQKHNFFRIFRFRGQIKVQKTLFLEIDLRIELEFETHFGITFRIWKRSLFQDSFKTSKRSNSLHFLCFLARCQKGDCLETVRSLRKTPFATPPDTVEIKAEVSCFWRCRDWLLCLRKQSLLPPNDSFIGSKLAFANNSTKKLQSFQILFEKESILNVKKNQFGRQQPLLLTPRIAGVKQALWKRHCFLISEEKSN